MEENKEVTSSKFKSPRKDAFILSDKKEKGEKSQENYHLQSEMNST